MEKEAEPTGQVSPGQKEFRNYPKAFSFYPIAQQSSVHWRFDCTVAVAGSSAEDVACTRNNPSSAPRKRSSCTPNICRCSRPSPPPSEHPGGEPIASKLPYPHLLVGTNSRKYWRERKVCSLDRVYPAWSISLMTRSLGTRCCFEKPSVPDRSSS